MWDGECQGSDSKVRRPGEFCELLFQGSGPSLPGSEFEGGVCVWRVTVGSTRLSQRVSRMEGRRAWAFRRACSLASSLTWVGDKVLDFALFCFRVLFSISQQSIVQHPSNIVSKLLFCVLSRCGDTEVGRQDRHYPPHSGVHDFVGE